MRRRYNKITKFLIPAFFTIIAIALFSAKIDTDNYVVDFIKKELPQYKYLIENPEKYRLQIIVTEINRDASGKASLTNHYYRTDKEEYFYPASSVKMPLAALALHKLNNYKIDGLNKNTRLKIAPYSCQSAITTDEISVKGYPTMGDYIRKMFLVSDNSAYNHTYEFLGQKYANEELVKMGLSSTKITMRYYPPCAMDNSFTQAFTFYNENKKIILEQKQESNKQKIENNSPSTQVGKKHYTSNGKLVLAPKNFSQYNAMSLQDLHKVLCWLVFPESGSPFNLSDDDRKFLLKYLALYPAESGFKNYSGFKNTHGTYFYFGQDENSTANKNIRSFNIIGRAYGFLNECAYLVDFENKTEILVSACIYINENEIVNDDVYEYYTIGIPFFRDFGKTLLKKEAVRSKEFSPNLEELKEILSNKDL